MLVLVAFFHSIPSSSSLPMYEQGFNLCHSSGQVTAQLRTGQQVPADARTTAFVHALAYKQAEAEAESRAGGAMRVGYTSTHRGMNSRHSKWSPAALGGGKSQEC
ncbi:hypothetical protein PSTT_09817 [Puccinia striiformis]|uniref:Uncharacterized protein n=1 Tax=Puccinia striiformis TaxID=27350 RepID=A0A2S4V6W7_9BASI|nr:hypothetical protein PSTT_09817 [Puccinia striiformis]